MLQKVKIWYRNVIRNYGHGMVGNVKRQRLQIILWKDCLKNMYRKPCFCSWICFPRDISSLILPMLCLLFSMRGYRRGAKLLRISCLEILESAICLKNWRMFFLNNLGNIRLFWLPQKGSIYLAHKMKTIVRCGCLLFDI